MYKLEYNKITETPGTFYGRALNGASFPVTGPTPVAGGTGTEVIFNQPIPAKYLIRIR